jgi:UDP-galactose transporter
VALHPTPTKRSATYEGIQEDLLLEHPRLNRSVGLLAVLAACTVSGLASVYFEKGLKDSNTSASLWVRNVQLSFYSLFLRCSSVLCFGWGDRKAWLFEGYNWVVWTAVCFQAFGGIALCVNYADNIAKNFATSISIVLSLLASIWFSTLTLPEV